MTSVSPLRWNVQGEATRTRLIAVAERLFADRGIAAVSLRQIAAAARQKNNAAIQYHFGNKDGLLRAIATDRARVSEDQRAAMLADCVVQPSGYEVVDLVEAMVRPLSAHLRHGDHYLAFLARLVTERGGFPDIGGDLPGANAHDPGAAQASAPRDPQ